MLTESIGAHRQGTGEKVVPEVKAVELCADSRSSATRCACKQDSPWSLVTAHEVSHNDFMLFATTYANIYIVSVSLNTQETKTASFDFQSGDLAEIFSNLNITTVHILSIQKHGVMFSLLNLLPDFQVVLKLNSCFLYIS